MRWVASDVTETRVYMRKTSTVRHTTWVVLYAAADATDRFDASIAWLKDHGFESVEYICIIRETEK